MENQKFYVGHGNYDYFKGFSLQYLYLMDFYSKI